MARIGHGLKEHFEAGCATDILGRCAPFSVDEDRQRAHVGISNSSRNLTWCSQLSPMSSVYRNSEIQLSRNLVRRAVLALSTFKNRSRVVSSMDAPWIASDIHV